MVVDLSRFRNKKSPKLDVGDTVRILSMETLHVTDDPRKLQKGLWTTPPGEVYLAMVLGQAQVHEVALDDVLGQVSTLQLNRMGWMGAEDFGPVLEYVQTLQRALSEASIPPPEPPECLQGTPILETISDKKESLPET